jgi:hypothetical protein
MIGSPTNFQHTGHIGSGDVDTGNSRLRAIQNQMQSKGGYETAFSTVQVKHCVAWGLTLERIIGKLPHEKSRGRLVDSIKIYLMKMGWMDDSWKWQRIMFNCFFMLKAQALKAEN